MKEKSLAYKVPAILLICLLVNAIILGVSSDYFHTPNEITGRHILNAYLFGIYGAFIFIVINGHWLLYGPIFSVFHLLVVFIKRKSTTYYVFFGAMLGVIFALPVIFLTRGTEPDWWYDFPSYKNWLSVPTYGFVGATFGFLYKRWVH